MASHKRQALALSESESTVHDSSCGAIVIRMMDRGPVHKARSTEEDEDKFPGLIEAITSQDRVAFERFYDLTVERVYGLALRISQHAETAEEIVSDAYLQVWQRAYQYNATRGSVIGWLMTICRTRALDALRRKTNTVEHFDDIDQIDQLADDSTSQQDIILATQRESAIHTAIKQLDAEQRQLLAMAFYRGYSHQELADFTGLPLGTVKTQIRRSIQKLKKYMTSSGAMDLV